MKTKLLYLTILMNLLIVFGCNDTSSNNNDVKKEQLSLLERGFVLPVPYGTNIDTTPPLNSQIIKEEVEELNLNTLFYKDYNLTIAPSILIPTIQPIRPDLAQLIWQQQADLLIVTDEDFIPALEPLVTHKESIGIKTKVLSWQKLTTSFNGRDDPEKIKKGLAFYVKNMKSKYIMLVGDSDKFPVRYCKVYDNVHWGDGWVSTDLYYADLYKGDDFASWDNNNNNLFCEMVGTEASPSSRYINVDQIDASIDVPVGRVPASTSNEVTTYVNKIIQYESNGYQDYMNKALLLVPGTKDGFDTYPNSKILKENVASDLSDIGEMSITKKYHNLQASTINTTINNGYGLINFAGHGAPWGWDFGYTTATNSDSSYTNSNIVSLKNQNQLPIVFSVACSTGRYIFDQQFKAKNGQIFNLSTTCKYDPNNGIQGCLPAPKANTQAQYMPEPSSLQPSSYDMDSMAEYFLLKNTQGGGVAFIGSTDATQNIAQDIDKYFSYMYAIGFVLKKSDLATPTLGSVWKYTLNTYGANHVNLKAKESSDWTQSIPFAHLLKYHLFGDPSLQIGGAE